MYKVRRPVDTNDAIRGFWPRYQEPGPLTFLQGVRTLLGPLALLLRPPGLATNLQSLNAAKEAGGSPTDLTGDPTKRVKIRADIWPDQPDVPAVIASCSNPLF